MRRRLTGVLAGAAAFLLLAGSAEAALEPVSITATAPQTVTVGSTFKLEVKVEAEAGALDIAAQPLLIGVKLAPECGGSFVGTPGSPALERTLTVPAGAAANQAFSAEVTPTASGTEVLCTFLQDSQERQFATDTEAEVTVQTAAATPAHQRQEEQKQQRCSTAKTALTQVKRDLRRLDRRIAGVRRQLRHAHGAHRKVLARQLHKLRSKRRKLARQRYQVARTTAVDCP